MYYIHNPGTTLLETHMDTYRHLCTRFYDLDKPAAPDDALNFYVSYAEKADGTIFEPMCGTGRYLIPMVEMGFDVEGSDASTHMLAVCRERVATKNLKLSLREEFLQHMSTPKRYALIFIPSGSFGLITDPADAKKCLSVLHQHLQPNGKLVFEVETIHSLPKNMNESPVRAVRDEQTQEQLHLTTTATYNEHNQIYQVCCRYDLIKHDTVIQTENELFEIRLYFNNEMDSWLQEAGFRINARFGDYLKRKSDANDEMIIYECSLTD